MQNIIIYAIPGLAFLVLIHELGHLVIARLCGIKVEAFAIFFGRPIYSIAWKGIEWRIGWIPFGGYCKMKGQEDFGQLETEGSPDEFYQRPAWARLYTVLAGPIFNIILGFLFIAALTYIDKELIIPNAPIVVHSSSETGLQSGDIIHTIDREKVLSWNSLHEHMLNGIHKETQILEVERSGKAVQVRYTFNKEERLKHNLGFSIPQILSITKIHKSIEYGISKDKKILEQANPIWGKGLMSGDIIVALDGEYIYSVRQLSELLNGKRGERELQVLRISERQKDKITAIDGQKSYRYSPKFLSQRSHTVTIAGESGTQEQKGQLKTIRFTPLSIPQAGDQSSIPEHKQYIGVQLAAQYMPAIVSQQYYKDYSLIEALQYGARRTWNLMALALKQFQLLTQVSGTTVRENLSGPIGIIQVIGEQGSKGFKQYISMLALFSLFLGIFNLLPIPAVDGGHVVLCLFEMIRRKPLSLKVVKRIQIVGVVIVVSIAILVTINDVLRWVA